MKSKLIITPRSPIIIKGDNDKFIQEVMDQLRITKLRFQKNKILVNPRYELGA